MRSKQLCSVAGCGRRGAVPRENGAQRKDGTTNPLCMVHRERLKDGFSEAGMVVQEGGCLNCGARRAEVRGYCRPCYGRMMNTAVVMVSDEKYGVLCRQEDERSYF